MATKKAKSTGARQSTEGPYTRSSKPASFGERLFDARPDRLDFRDLPYRPPLRSLPARYPVDADIAAWLPAYVRAGLILNQGAEGACTGFGLACVANYLLWTRHLMVGGKGHFAPVSPRMLYELARRYDEWPGEQYDGSSCRGAIKGWHKHGICSHELWPYPFDADDKPVFVSPREGWEFDAAQRTLGVYYRVSSDSVVDLQAAIAEIGAVFVSARVHNGWDSLMGARAKAPPRRHDDIPVIAPPDGGEFGGHAFALIGYNERGFIIQNSWGRAWGASGFAVLPYEDWVTHGTDAWACALGVPVLPSPQRLRAARWPVRSGRALTTLAPSARAPRNPPDDPWPIDHEYECRAYEPWSTDDAYRHTLVTDNDGCIAVRDFTRGVDAGAADYVGDIVHDSPLRFFKQQKSAPWKLAIYAHGGLNGEEASIARNRVLGPYFEANGIYPLFLSWKTGPGETLRDIVQDWARKVFGGDDAVLAASIAGGLGEMRDRAVEVAARLFGRGIWSEMRENAERGLVAGHGLDLLAQQLGRLKATADRAGRPLELHLLGHSAGSILLGHLLERWLQPDLQAQRPLIATASLYAAACSVRFAVQRYLAAADAGLLPLHRLHLYQLSDANEKADGLPSPGVAAYGKSLLYLVSRALDDQRKMPLLGMERALLPAYASDGDQWARGELPFVQRWQQHWPAKQGCTLVEPTVRTTRRGDRIAATHGSFDNNIEVLTETLQRIRGAALVAPMEWLDY